LSIGQCCNGGRLVLAGGADVELEGMLGIPELEGINELVEVPKELVEFKDRGGTTELPGPADVVVIFIEGDGDADVDGGTGIEVEVIG